MKGTIKLTIVGMLALTTLAGASEISRSDTNWKLTVYMDGAALVPLANLRFAQNMAVSMLASAGVDVHWRTGNPPTDELERVVRKKEIRRYAASFMSPYS